MVQESLEINWKETNTHKSQRTGKDVMLKGKDAANMINTVFTDLTKDFPEIQSE